MGVLVLSTGAAGRAQARHLGQLLNSVCKLMARVALIFLERASGETTYIRAVMLSTPPPPHISATTVRPK